MSVMRYLGQASRAYCLYRDIALKDLGLSGYKGTYLSVIHHHPGITQDMLADKLVFNKSSVTRQVAELEEAGFVRRERDPEDRRQIHVWTTEKGESVLHAVWETNQNFLRQISEEFTPEEMALLEAMSSRLCRRAKEAIRKK